MKKRIVCTIVILVLLISFAIATFAEEAIYEMYYGAKITVHKNGYSGDLGMPTAEVSISTSSSEGRSHQALVAMKIPGEYDWRESFGSSGTTSSASVSAVVIGQPPGLQTDYGAVIRIG